jgi:hypothetical protein
MGRVKTLATDSPQSSLFRCCQQLTRDKNPSDKKKGRPKFGVTKIILAKIGLSIKNNAVTDQA